jgi:hypothetical protein
MAEFTLGSLSGTPVVASNFVGDSDTQDIYSFTLDSIGSINLALTGLSADADVRLYQDTNNNGVIDIGTDRFVSSSARGGSNDDSINVEAQAAGDYLVDVYRFSTNNTNYDLRLSTTSTYTASNLLPTETEVGNLNGTETFYGSVGENDTADVYHFILDSARDFSLSLTGLSSDADVRLIQDRNSNLVVDAGEVIASSTAGSTFSESINEFLSTGEYFVEVYQYTANTDFNSYTLSLTA